jgi:Ca2+/Na+ antiporter
LYSAGNTFGIPDSVMGLTLLAAGGCLPEAFSSIIMARKGESCTRICHNKKFLGIIKFISIVN